MVFQLYSQHFKPNLDILILFSTLWLYYQKKKKNLWFIIMSGTNTESCNISTSRSKFKMEKNLPPFSLTSGPNTLILQYSVLLPFLLLSSCVKHYSAVILGAVVMLRKVYWWQLSCVFCSRVSPVELLLWRMLLLWGWQVVERCCSGPEPELEPELEPKPAEEPSPAGPTRSAPTPFLRNNREYSSVENTLPWY